MKKTEKNDKTIEVKEIEQSSKTLTKTDNKTTDKTLNKKTSAKSSKHKIYFDYKTRLTFNIIMFLLFFSASLIFATKTLEREQLDPISYNQKGTINYKVYLNENNYYTEEYLGMNKAYIASLINNLDIDFNYLFSIEKDSVIDYDYKIIGELVIENSNGLNRYFEKKYTLLDTKKTKLNNSKVLEINENLKIDYSYYNGLANSFKSEYGIDTNSYLNVYMEVSSKSDESLNYKINEQNKIGLKIPLSERAIEINIDSSNQNITKQIIPKGSVIFNVIFLTAEIVFFIITCIFLSKIIKYLTLLMKRQTEYDKYVNKILKDYDRLIVETKTEININACNIIDVNSFTELLDVRDNLKMPIMYFNITKHEKGMFYIKNNNDVYRIIIKNVDLNK